MPDIPLLAKQAYYAFAQVRNESYAKTDSILRCPPWVSLSDADREAWCAAVEEVLSRA